jgi:hypothetical protein
MARWTWAAATWAGLFPFVAHADVAEDLAKAARSPEELVRFVETHGTFEWAPLWKTLGIKSDDVFLPNCEETGRGIADCSAELTTVVEPFQVIVILTHNLSHFQAYLRYRRLSANRWTFAGAHSPYVKYFAPEHRIVRLGAKPFLAITEQGNAGTGLTSTVEQWIDLTRDNFKPVFSYTRDGHNQPYPGGLGRSVQGFVVSFEESPSERITVVYNIDFRTYGRENDILVCRREDTAVYVRAVKNAFVLDPNLSSTTADEIGKFYEDLASGYTDEEFLKFNFEGLKKVLSENDAKAREWLWDFLSCCPNSPEAKQLRALSESRAR